MTPEEIKTLIEQGIACAEVRVDGDGSHFSAVVVSDAFQGLNVVKQHKLVYGTLGGRMGGEIHALSIQAYTPEQWETARKLQVLS
jgi:acid stress-induced BolA-like protein IbaG/YrbA